MTDYDGEPDEHRHQRVDRDAQERRLAERERAAKAMTLTEFLLARIAEDEAVAQDHAPEEYPDGVAVGVFGWSDMELLTINPARVLAECAAKRRIVERADRMTDDDEFEQDGWRLLGTLASVYADHPDYRQEWAL